MLMRTVKLVSLSVGILTLQATHVDAQQNNPKTTQSASVMGDKTPAAGSPAANAGSDYIIGPEDVLDINVWKEPDLTRLLPVRPDGKISMPLLNDVQAAGLTTTQLSQSISEKLKKYLTSPQVTVMVSQINSQRIYVMGEVTRPGAYPLLPGMTILQAISSAGGLTQFANSKKIFLLRTENKTQNKYPFSYKDVLDGRRAEQNLPLKAGDTVVVP
ncbi:MAG: sugar transporter [Proteobacteria bacterium]|nr:MAG: sugar transporter [Pseudomonadota bacterium]